MHTANEQGADAASTDAPRPRRRLHAPLSAALAGLGLIAAVPDAGAAIARPDFAATPMDTVLDPVDVLANDTLANGQAYLTYLGGAAGAGSLSVNLLPGGALSSLRFVPAPGFTGARIVDYCIADTPSGSPNACSYLYLSVQSPNIASYIIASDDFYTTTSGVPLENLQVLANDMFDPSALSVNRLLSEQAIGGLATASPDGDGNQGYSPSNIPPTPPVNVRAFMIDYVPNPGFTGLDRFQYCIDDFFQPGTQTCATVYINVLPAIVSAPATPVPTMNGYALAGLSGALGWLALRLRRRR